MSFRAVSTIFLFAALALGTACGQPPPKPIVKTGAKRVDAATAGSISGRVIFTGTPPKPATIRLTGDAACLTNGPTTTSDNVLVAADGAVENAFVYVKSGLDDYTFDVPPDPVTLDQKNCRYVPHVLGLQVGQTLDIVNDDATLHNVHALPMSNQEFNQGEGVKGQRVAHVFTVPEVMIRFMCNVHSWMSAYVGVLPHPFFAVTGADGAFTLKGVPPGTYTIEAWHEKFGTTSQTVTVPPSGHVDASFTFAAK